MSYYQGDYYRGGFLSFLGGIAKKAVGFIPGVGPIASAALATIPKAQMAVRPVISGMARTGVAAGRMMAKHPVLSAAGAAGALAGGAALLHHRGVSAAAGMAGGGFGRRRKHINVCNPRALRRAIRRTHGFAKLAMKTIHLVHPKKKARFGGFKRRKKK
jgi:hypothetical protein